MSSGFGVVKVGSWVRKQESLDMGGGRCRTCPTFVGVPARHKAVDLGAVQMRRSTGV